MERQTATKFFIKRQKRKRRRLIQSLILLSITLIIFWFGSAFIKGFNSGNSKGLMNPFVAGSSIKIEDPAKEESPLGLVVKKVLEGSQGDYAIAIKNLKTGETYFLNEKKVYEIGSLYKLWVMAEAYKQIQEGSLTEDEELSDTIPDLNQKFNISPEDAELTYGTIALTVRDAIKQMIVISHNYAAMLLSDRLGISGIENLLKADGFNASALRDGVEAPSSDAYDIMLFFEKLYKGELANPTFTNSMFDILKAQESDGGLPKYLPEGTVVGNKTGDIGWFKHDAGIVFAPSGDYIIVVMSESEDPAGAQDRIALISKAVFDYFTK